MFLKFSDHDERRKYGGSAYIEFQFCKLKEGTRLKRIISVNSIDNWKEDSLYIHVDVIDDFINEYGDVFNCGIYNNLNSGIVDIFGINYYNKEQVSTLIKIIESKKPKDYEKLILWLEEALQYNGFYILGI